VRPHVPLVAPSNHFETYRDAVPELPDVPEGDRDDIPSEGISLNSEVLGLDGNPGRKRAVIKAYSAAVSYMDAQVQLILDALNGLELAGNTIVIFTSDHGYHLGEHDLWQKVSLHEESVRVPMIVAGPGIRPGVSSRLAAHVDLYPTIAALCGLAVPEKCQGVDISPLLKGDERSLREGVHSCTGRGHLWRTERYAYMQYRSGAEEIYDMEADPQQFNNLANSDDPDIRRIVGEHRGALERFLAGLPDYGAMEAAGPRR
jgi:iduronate 2-sulfatase